MGKFKPFSFHFGKESEPEPELKPVTERDEAMQGNIAESRDRMARVQSQVDETRGIMQENVDLTISRGENLEDLESQANKLQSEAGQFSRSARAVQENMAWKRKKMWIIGGAVVVVLILVIIFVSVVAARIRRMSFAAM